jgi:ABC-type uncharacterized transport system auxiliary subunit
MARGRKPTRDAKRANIVVRFQADELNAIKDYGKREGKPASTLIREIVLNHFEANGIPTQLTVFDPNQLTIDTDND